MVNRKPMGNGFFHDHRIGRQNLAELIGGPASMDGLCVLPNQRLLLPFVSSFFKSAAPLFRATGRLGSAFGNPFLYTLKQVLQRAFNRSRENNIDRESPIREFCPERILGKD